MRALRNEAADYFNTLYSRRIDSGHFRNGLNNLRKGICMAIRKIHGYPVLILGAGRGGAALLEMFIEDEHVEVLGIVDPDEEAPGILLAIARNIPAYRRGFAPRQGVGLFVGLRYRWHSRGKRSRRPTRAWSRA